MAKEEIDLIEVVWEFDEDLQEWVLIAREAPPNPNRHPVDHWMKEDSDGSETRN